jgi:hypothetical protein
MVSCSDLELLLHQIEETKSWLELYELNMGFCVRDKNRQFFGPRCQACATRLQHLREQLRLLHEDMHMLQKEALGYLPLERVATLKQRQSER